MLFGWVKVTGGTFLVLLLELMNDWPKWGLIRVGYNRLIISVAGAQLLQQLHPPP